MRIFWAWLVGMTMGVGLMIATKGVSASQAHLLTLYGVGVVAAVLAAAALGSAAFSRLAVPRVKLISGAGSTAVRPPSQAAQSSAARMAAASEGAIYRMGLPLSAASTPGHRLQKPSYLQVPHFSGSGSCSRSEKGKKPFSASAA